MPNPFKALTDYLHGADLKTPAIQNLGSSPERKLYYIDDQRMAILVHGPGATRVLEGEAANSANSAVYACLTAICTAYPEAPVRVYMTPDGGDRQPMPENPLQALLDAPNPYMSSAEVWWWTQWAKHCDGNAYWRKIRAGNPETGNVVQLWPISPTLIAPFTERGSPNFIDYYKYYYKPGSWEKIPVENIVHFKLGIDDKDHRKGLSPLKRLVAEVCTDDQASLFSDALLRNFAVPGVVVMTTDPDLSEEAANTIKQRVQATFGSDGRGTVGVLGNGSTMQQFGFSPEQLDLKGLHRLPEERIAAVLRVPAIIAGLGAGLDRSTFANFKEAREMFTEQTILPLYTFDDATLNSQLLPDFTSDTRVSIAHDITDVRALQDDENAKYTRLDIAVRSGWITPNEARSDVGLPPMEGGDAPHEALPPPQLALPAGKSRVEVKGIDVADFPSLLSAMVDLAEPKLTEQLDAYFNQQRIRTKRKLLGS